MSDDYAVPPDALSCDTTSLESSLLLRASYLDSPKRTESLEKSGSLAKLGNYKLQQKINLCLNNIISFKRRKIKNLEEEMVRIEKWSINILQRSK